MACKDSKTSEAADSVWSGTGDGGCEAAIKRVAEQKKKSRLKSHRPFGTREVSLGW